MRFTNSLSLTIALGATLLGCQKEPAPSAEPAASIEKPSTLDPALAKAVAAASVGVPARGGPAAAGSGGPPSGGVFAPGAADKEIKKGDAPKLTLGGQGSEPRVQLGPMQPKPGWKSSGTVQIAMQGDARQQALPIELSVTLEAQKPKAAEGAGGAAGVTPVLMVAKVTGARVGMTGLPPEIASRVEKLKGSKVEYEVLPDGSGTGYRSQVPAGAEDVRDQLRVLSDMLALVTLPVPQQPLGEGAFWMATSREGVFGLDLVTYRLVKVEKVTDKAVTLSVGTKRYATSAVFEFEGLPPDAPRDLAEFESKSDGRIELPVGAPFPQSGEIQSVLVAALAQSGQQRGVLQIQSRAGFDFTKR
jgi:hypothetical protein